MNTSVAPIETDAVIVGAGPVGLFQVFELGLLEIKAHVIDSLNAVGGQCVELYPDKPIYDIPAVPSCTGQELTDNLLKQIEPFEPTFHLGQEVTLVQKREDGRFDLETSTGTKFITKTIFIAAGVGSFQPRTIKVDGIEKFEEKQLFYRVKDPARFEGRNIVICGGGDSALDWALNLQGKAESVILVHRRDEFRAAPASVAKMKELCEQYEMQFLVGQISGFDVGQTFLLATTVYIAIPSLMVFLVLVLRPGVNRITGGWPNNPMANALPESAAHREITVRSEIKSDVTVTAPNSITVNVTGQVNGPVQGLSSIPLSATAPRGQTTATEVPGPSVPK